MLTIKDIEFANDALDVAEKTMLEHKEEIEDAHYLEVLKTHEIFRQSLRDSQQLKQQQEINEESGFTILKLEAKNKLYLDALKRAEPLLKSYYQEVAGTKSEASYKRGYVHADIRELLKESKVK